MAAKKSHKSTSPQKPAKNSAKQNFLQTDAGRIGAAIAGAVVTEVAQIAINKALRPSESSSELSEESSASFPQMPRTSEADPDTNPVEADTAASATAPIKAGVGNLGEVMKGAVGVLSDAVKEALVEAAPVPVQGAIGTIASTISEAGNQVKTEVEAAEDTVGAATQSTAESADATKQSLANAIAAAIAAARGASPQIAEIQQGSANVVETVTDRVKQTAQSGGEAAQQLLDRSMDTITAPFRGAPADDAEETSKQKSKKSKKKDKKKKKSGKKNKKNKGKKNKK